MMVEIVNRGSRLLSLPMTKARGFQYLDFVTFLTLGFRGGGFQVGINLSGRVDLTLPDKLNSRWESLSRKMTSKKLQSREYYLLDKEARIVEKRGQSERSGWK